MAKVLPFITAVFIAILSFTLPTPAQSAELTLAIANSTCATMKKAGAIFTTNTGIKLNYLCQPSGLLAQGITEGELKVDYYLSANKIWMDTVVAKGFIAPEAINKHWGNRLVIASLPLKPGEVQLQSLADLKNPGIKQILIGDPRIAPYGIYAKEALVNTDLWDTLQHKLKYNRKISMSIRTLKKFGLSRTGVVAIVYQTNTRGRVLSHNVRSDLLTHFVIPQHHYSEIRYYCAPLLTSSHPDELQQFMTFIKSAEVDAIFANDAFILHPLSH